MGNNDSIRSVRRQGDTVIAAAAGDIDLSHSAEFQQQSLKLLDERPRKLVMNLFAVSYMDSSGVASMVKLLSRAKKFGTTLVLVGLTDRVRSVFEITRLNSVFAICKTEEEALARG